MRIGKHDDERQPEISDVPKAVLYVAADRPRQIARSFRRMVREGHRAALEWLTVWSGPLPFDLAADGAERLTEFAAEFGAGTIVLDSLKDVALDLSKEETGSRVNLALQHTLAAGVEVLAIHHQRKGGPTAASRGASPMSTGAPG